MLRMLHYPSAVNTKGNRIQKIIRITTAQTLKQVQVREFIII
jgi:hypothetical protein